MQGRGNVLVVVVWVLLMNTKNAYSDEEMRKFQDIDFDAERVKRLEGVSSGLDECQMGSLSSGEPFPGRPWTWGELVAIAPPIIPRYGDARYSPESPQEVALVTSPIRATYSRSRRCDTLFWWKS